jgi:hypothetical protein
MRVSQLQLHSNESANAPIQLALGESPAVYRTNNFFLSGQTSLRFCTLPALREMAAFRFEFENHLSLKQNHANSQGL